METPIDALTMALPNAPSTINASASRKRDSGGVKLSYAAEEERTNQCCKRGSGRLTNCGHVRNCTQKCNEKSRGRDPNPNPIPIK